MDTNSPNIARRTLLGIGAALVILGGTVALFAQQAGDRATRVDRYVGAISGYASHSADGPYIWMWIGIVAAILGALIFLGVLFLRAAENAKR